MKSLFHLAVLLGLMPAALLLTGCEDSSSSSTAATQEADYWDPAWGPAPNGEGGEVQEVIRDTAYIVVEKRQAGGQLVPDASEKSALDGRPRMKRTPLESMIVVEGNMTGQRSAYLLPETDYNIVQVGHRLQQSTLGRWESASEDRVPSAAQQQEERLRSRTGGAAEQFAY